MSSSETSWVGFIERQDMELQSVLQKQFLWSNELNWLYLQAVSSLYWQTV